MSDTPPQESPAALRLVSSTTGPEPSPDALSAQPSPGDNVSPVELSEDEKQLAIVQMLNDGRPYREICRTLRVGPPRVVKAARELDNWNDAARKYLSSKSLDAADAWHSAMLAAALKGNHVPARDLLLHTGAIDPLPDSNGHGGTRIAIVIGTPEAPIVVTDRKD